MATSGAALLLRKPGQPGQATFLELFFDLVFVFALTRVSQRLVQDITSEGRVAVTEAGETFLVLLAVWMVWFSTVLVTDVYDPERPQIQLLVVATMFGSMVMAEAAPNAFSNRALPFAGAYVAIHLGRELYLVYALRGHEAQRRAMRALFWFALSAVPWIIGALFAGVVRGVLWPIAVALEYLALMMRLPVPKLGRPPESELPIVPEHLSERYRQFFIIALGELIVVAGRTAGIDGLNGGQATAFWVSFITTALMWRIYIYRAGEQLPFAIARARQPGRLALWLSAAHLVMVIGLVAAAASFQLIIRHPLGHTDDELAAVTLGGPAMFLVGRGVFEYAVFNRISASRVVGVVILGISAPAVVRTHPLAASVLTAAVLLGVAVTDGIRGRSGQLEPSPST